MSSPTKQRSETMAEKWHRLARLASEQGVTLLRAHCTGEVFATSISHPGEIHRLTPSDDGFACSCEGWARWQRCKHAAALLADLGWLPTLELELPAAVSASVCSTCGGNGFDPGCEGHPIDVGYIVRCPCATCDGAGRAPASVSTTEEGVLLIA